MKKGRKKTWFPFFFSFSFFACPKSQRKEAISHQNHNDICHRQIPEGQICKFPSKIQYHCPPIFP